MKKILKTGLIVSSLAINIMAETISVDDSILIGSSKDNPYKKSYGLALDVEYASKHVDIGEYTDVNLTFVTGEKLVDDVLEIVIEENPNLIGLDKKEYFFKLSKEEHRFSIKLSLSSMMNNKHLLSISAKVSNKMKFFGIPIFVGNIEEKRVKKSKSGQRGFHIMKAVETIR